MAKHTFRETVFASPPALQGATDVLAGVGVVCGAVSEILGALPVMGIVTSSLDLLNDLGDVCNPDVTRSSTRDTNTNRRYAFYLKAAVNVSVIMAGVDALSHVITVGSAALGLMCYAFAIKSIVECGFAFSEYNQAKKFILDRETKDAALRKMYLSLMRAAGWILLSAAHLAITSSAAPALLIAGSVCLLAAGVYGAYHLYQNYKTKQGFFAPRSTDPLLYGYKGSDYGSDRDGAESPTFGGGRRGGDRGYLIP